MLRIHFGEMKGSMEYPDFFFDNIFNKDYMAGQFSKDVVYAIDKSRVKGKHLIISPVLGAISPRDLSTGAKNVLICRYYPEKIINFSYMGTNCLKPLFREIVKENLDRTICADILYNPYNYGYTGSILILNSNTVVTCDSEFLDEFLIWKESNIYER